MADDCIFTIKADHFKFTTQPCGDCVEITKAQLGSEQAANLAALINIPDGVLVVEIKQQGES